jgi:hypothetical protein
VFVQIKNPSYINIRNQTHLNTFLLIYHLYNCKRFIESYFLIKKSAHLSNLNTQY